MKSLIVIAIAVAAAVIAFLIFRPSAPSPVLVAPSDPPALKVIDIHPTLGENRDAELDKLEGVLKSQYEAFTAQLKLLTDRLEKAEKAEDTKSQEELIRQWNELIQWQVHLNGRVDNFASWIKEHEKPLADDEELPGNDLIPPPPPVVQGPPPATSTTTTEGGKGMDLGPMVELAGSVACVVNPALCVPIAAALKFLKLFEGDTKQLTETLDTIGKIAAGESVTEEELNRAFDTFETIGQEALERWETLVAQSGTAGAKSVVDSVRKWVGTTVLGEIDAVLAEIHRAVEDGAKSYDDLPPEVRDKIDSVLGSGFATMKQKRVFMVELQRRLSKDVPEAIRSHFNDLKVR